MSFWKRIMDDLKAAAPPVPAKDPLPLAVAAVAPNLLPADQAAWVDALREPMVKAEIVTPRRVSMFLGQDSEESGGFRVLSEDLRYTAQGLLRTWPTHFHTAALAKFYAAEGPEAIANYVYANREGNGPPASGDGWRYRGGGLMQLTFHDAYAMGAADAKMTVPAYADWVRTPAGAAHSACWYWSLRKLNPLADAWDIEGVTKRINGGLINLQRRTATCEAALRALA